MARIFCALAVALACFSGGGLSAQTIRFDTNVGTFDMRLNPEGNPFLQQHVDNMLAYTLAGRFDQTIINRAPDGFVLQMGGFQTRSLTLDVESYETLNQNGVTQKFNVDFPSIAKFDPVVVDTNGNNVVSFSTTGLSNTRNTVTLALGSNNQGVPLVSSGTSSFFVNIGSNTSLDVGQARGGFIPFAEIEDMATIDLIMAVPKEDINAVARNNQQWNPTFGDIPLLENDKIVYVERAYLVDTSDAIIASAIANADLESLTAEDSLTSEPVTSPLSSVPEPTSLALMGTMAMLSIMARRR